MINKLLFTKQFTVFLTTLVITFSFWSCQNKAILEPISQESNRAISAARVQAEPRIVLGYFPSWSESWVSNTTINQSKLVSLPATVTHVFFAFAKPNLTYTKGSYDLSATGIQVPYDGNTLKLVVAAAKQKGLKIILSVGGETYWYDNSAYNINYQQIKDLVDDMGFEGIDWDFEPNGSFAEIGSTVNVNRFIDFFTKSRAIMPKSSGYLLTCAPAGVGALGGLNNDDTASPFAYNKRNILTGDTDQFLYSFTDPQRSIGLFGFATTGHMIPVMKAVGDKIDIVAYQGYNTGAAPKRTLMYDSYAYYANIYGFRIAAGITLPNEPWGPYYTYTPAKTTELAQYIKNGGTQNRQASGDGMMLWQLLMTSATNPAENGVTYANSIASTLNGTIPLPTTPQTPLVNQASIKLGNAISGSVAETGTLLILKDGTQIATKAVNTGNWTYAPTQTGSFTFKLSVNNVASVASQAVTVTNEVVTNGGCGYAGYNAALSYPTAGTKVFYNGKIYENKWWVNPNDAPDDSNTWGAWKFIQNCTSDNAPVAPTVNQTTVILGNAITGSVVSNGTLIILKDGLQTTTIAVSAGNWSYTPTSLGLYTFKLSANSLVSAASSEVRVSSSLNTCGYLAYNATIAYPTAGTRVYYNGKIYESKWWISAGDAPDDSNTWGAWKFIQLCQ